MVNVAVAGGLGHLGRTIVEALQKSPKHNVIMLVRESHTNQGPDARRLVVDYHDVDGLANVLESEQIHTVVSAIKILNDDAGKAESNLVLAASKSAPTKRFVTSDWGYPVPEDAVLPQKAIRNSVCHLLRQSGLEWTRFFNGFFLDYYGLPHVESHMDPTTFVVDVSNKVAAIPGMGNDPMTWTYTRDVASFVVAALDVPDWEEETYCYGDKMTWNEFVQLAEEATGSKFTTTHDDVSKLQRGEITELPGHLHEYEYIPKPFFQAMFASFGLHVVGGCFNQSLHVS
ncbi:hypothetical protein B0T10DRAFT_608896 [Thelonectria olida]|uniref:NmrA-like domain-containing protein n=1 Tax=Thelonectria olida TaxID=1576542 RepID=A0A9P9AME0_9HYPO|nr:hypothetical protein B0T10DRAFT_608896 [Thelonectria olida]